jgi:hypothetical protein
MMEPVQEPKPREAKYEEEEAYMKGHKDTPA